MSVTDELRKYVQDWRETPSLMDDLDAGDIDGLLGDIEHIADHIDAEYEEAIQQVLMDECGVPATDENMAKHGWVRLPKDANGAYIHVGDVVIESLPFGGESKPLVVDRMELGRYDGKDAWAVALDTDKSPWAQPPLLHHHHEPTVEDVLRELEGMRGNGATYEDVVARCDELAKTLRGLLAVRTNERQA